MGVGVNYSTGMLLVDPLDEQYFAEKIRSSLSRISKEVRVTTRVGEVTTSFREIRQKQQLNMRNPKEAGWTFLINEKDPNKNKIIAEVYRLPTHRGMKDPSNPLTFCIDLIATGLTGCKRITCPWKKISAHIIS